MGRSSSFIGCVYRPCSVCTNAYTTSVNSLLFNILQQGDVFLNKKNRWVGGWDGVGGTMKGKKEESSTILPKRKEVDQTYHV